MRELNKIKLLCVLCCVFIVLNLKTYSQPVYDWAGLGNAGSGFGTNGEVNAIVQFNGDIVAAGSFSYAGGIGVSNIASWNGSSWHALGQGLNDTVYSLVVYNGYLYAGGYFTQAGGLPANHIAKWNGSVWESVGTGLNNDVYALTVFNSRLIMAGKFNTYGENICAYDGNTWYQLGTGTDDDVYALTIYNGNLIAGGKFEHAGGNPASKIAKWNGSVWTALSTNTDDRIHALGVYGSYLVAGGRFSTIGGVSASYVAQYNGSVWSAIGGGVDDRVYAIASLRGNLIVAGQFRFAGGTLYADRIAQWDGSSWSRLITGVNNKANTLFVVDSSLYAGGEFITAGGKVVNRIGLYSNQNLRDVSGVVRFANDSQLVTTGKVRAYRMDLNSRELILEDSASIINGQYDLPKVRMDSLFIISFPDDELQDFVPTYHPSTIDWASAVKVYPVTNLTNVNINVFRITPGPQSPNPAVSVGGYVYLNYLPPFNPPQPLPFKSSSIVYVKSGNDYKKFGVSTDLEQYSIPNLSPGSYEVYVNRIGYTSGMRNIVVGTVNVDTINFTLDTISLIGIKNIGSEVPKDFVLKQNFPNPFNPSTKIQFAMAKTGFARLSIFNILGQEVQVLVNEELKSGEYEVTFNALKLSSGIYFYRLTTDNFSETRKMVLVK